MSAPKNPQSFDPYRCYEASVQSPEVDVRFYRRVFRQIHQREPRSFREDFCGTHALSAAWVRLHKQNVAYGLDIDPKPLRWGLKERSKELTPAQLARLFVFQGSVLVKDIVSTDIVVAANFSYCFFKSRDVLLSYFRNVRATIKKRGVFFLDVLGGSELHEPNTQKRRIHRDLEYFWEQKNFNPLTHEAEFFIHFRYRGKMHKRVFSYDWRVWTPPELKDLLLEAGFKEVRFFWEGTDARGRGNGVFREVKSRVDSCESWIAYLAAIP
jgi:hypothetical protein